MVKTLYSLSFLLMFGICSFAQNSINDYKYIIVPSQYEFQKEKDQYQLNSLTKFLFNKYGYTAYLQEDELPQDLRYNGCLALTTDVVEDGGLFKTKLRIDLKDCSGRIVASSQFGETREKEFARAYNFALRDAFTTFQNMEYSYQPNEAVLSKAVTPDDTVINNEQAEINRLKEEIKILKDEKTEDDKAAAVVVEAPIKEKTEDNTPEEKVKTVKSESSTISGMLYAQPIENGFQLVDNTPKVVLVLLNTGVKDVFSVKDSQAIVYKKDEVWMYSEDGIILKGKPLNIKF